MKARRTALSGINRPDAGLHVGLWLDKFLVEQSVDGERLTDAEKERVKTARSRHLKEIEEYAVPDGYKEAFERWKEDHIKSNHTLALAKVKGRMIVGLGDKNPLEMGITLQHTWGVPYIPGSALKGLASTTAIRLLEDEDWRRSVFSSNASPTSGGAASSDTSPTSGDILFGTIEKIGCVVFHDAWWCPPASSTSSKLPLHLDVMTVHHANYYQTDSAAPNFPNCPPSDTDSPNPISFLSVDGEYQIALSGDPVWCKAAIEILRIGLEELGIGAKTHSGYGRMKVGDIEDHRPMTPERWFEENHAAAAAQEASKQYETLLTISKSANAFPDGLSAEACKAELQRQLAKGIELAHQKASGQSDTDATQLQQQLDEHQKQKPPKKEKRELGQWENKMKKMQRQLTAAQNNEGSVQRAKEEASALLAWLAKKDEPTP